MSVAPEEIAQVRAATDMVALLGEHVALRKTGQRWTGLCPFHEEKTPSFSVNAEEGLYYCFGCQASGDAITFVRETQHLDFIDAVRQLAERAGIQLHEDADVTRGDGATSRCSTTPSSALSRGITSGCCPRPTPAVRATTCEVAATTLTRSARSVSAGRPTTGTCMVAVAQVRLGGGVDVGTRLREQGGAAAGCAARTSPLPDPRPGRAPDRDRRTDPAVALGTRRRQVASSPKYKNTQETPIYQKRKTLYGLNWAKKDVVATGEIVVCEGYTDVIAFFGAGVQRAVATCGTALAEDHFRVMRNFAKRIVLAYDADAAGQSAAASVYQWERTHEVEVSVCQAPERRGPRRARAHGPRRPRERRSSTPCRSSSSGSMPRSPAPTCPPPRVARALPSARSPSSSSTRATSSGTST